MGVKKSGGLFAKKTTKSRTGLFSKAGKVVSAIGGKLKGGKAARGMVRRHRVTPEKLARAILILRLKKRLYRMKYGGR